jgi:hypothetical protein
VKSQIPRRTLSTLRLTREGSGASVIHTTTSASSTSKYGKPDKGWSRVYTPTPPAREHTWCTYSTQGFVGHKGIHPHKSWCAVLLIPPHFTHSWSLGEGDALARLFQNTVPQGTKDKQQMSSVLTEELGNTLFLKKEKQRESASTEYLLCAC